MPRYTDLALGAGAVLAVGLGLFALKPDSLPTPDESARSMTSELPDPLKTRASAEPSTKSSATSKSTGSTKPAGSAADGWVVGAGDGLVVRAEHRGCGPSGPAALTAIGPGGGTVDRTVDGLTAVGGFRVENSSSAVLVGVDDGCERVGFGTKDAGRTWTKLDTVPAIWSLVPGAKDEVHAPSGQVGVPCEPLALTGLDDKVARLACVDGRLLGTVSGGDDWSILGNNDGMQAVAFVSATTALALTDADGCAGVEVERSTDGGTDFSPAYCVEGKGPWGLFAGGGAAVVVGSDKVAVSTDDGDAWDVTTLRG